MKPGFLYKLNVNNNKGEMITTGLVFFENEITSTPYYPLKIYKVGNPFIFLDQTYVHPYDKIKILYENMTGWVITYETDVF